MTERVASPTAPAAVAATALARRPSDDAHPPDSSSEIDTGPRPGHPRVRSSNGAPDPSGRSGGLVDVFA